MKNLLYILPAIVIIALLLFYVFSKKEDEGITPLNNDSDSIIGRTAVAKNPNGVNIRRGQGTSTMIIKQDATGKLGKVLEVVPGIDENGNKDGKNWYRIQLTNSATVGTQKYTIGYVREDVVTLE